VNDFGPPLEAESILRALNRHQVSYVVIGALGATLHGSPLRTGDIDICPDPDVRNLDQLAAALTDLGAKEWDPRKGEFFHRVLTGEALAADKVWIFETRYGEVDIVFEPAGTDGYRDLARDSVELDVSGTAVRVASLADIIRSKEAAGREKDAGQLPTLRRLLDRLNEEDEGR
jgi:hypothetical protein